MLSPQCSSNWTSSFEPQAYSFKQSIPIFLTCYWVETGQKLTTKYISRNFTEVEIDLSLSYQLGAYLTFELIDDIGSEFELSLKNKLDGSIQEVIPGQAIALSSPGEARYSLLIRNHNYEPQLLETEMHNLNLYPNPVDNWANLVLQSDYEGEIAVHLFSPLGVQVQHYSATKVGKVLEHQISMLGYQSGIYLLRIQAGDRSLVQRIVKN